MANQTSIIDIDSKFLENLKAADKALQHAASHATAMSNAFAKAVQGSGNIAALFQSIQSGLDKVGAKADFSAGFLKANTALRDTSDMVNTLAHNIDNAKSKYSEMLSSMANSNRKIGGPKGVQMLKADELNSIGKVQLKIKEIESYLGDGRRKPLATSTILKLTEFKEFYKAHVKELGKTDEQRINDTIAALRKEFEEQKRIIKAYEAEVKRVEKENVRVAKEAANERIRIANGLRKANMEALVSSPDKAISFAQKANTGNRLRVAKDVLTEARGRTTNAKDIANINMALQAVEDKLNKINGKELKLRVKENIGITKTSNDILALQEAINVLSRDRHSFNIDTAAGQREIAKIEEAIDRARAKIAEINQQQPATTIISDKEAKKSYRDLRREVRTPTTTDGQSVIDARAATSQRLLELQDQINTSTAKGYELYMKTGAQLRENEALMTKTALKSKDAKVSFDANAGALSIGKVESLVKMTNDAQTLRNAFEALRRAKRDINPNTEEGRAQLQRLNEVLSTTETRIKECSNQQSRFMQLFNRMKGTSSGLSSTFSRIFAVGAITGFANKVVRLHGEFEKLRKSLAVLTQSSEKAQLIWGKITRLAVQSPFTVADLATATRQMAAYRIEQDLIYEKTKMLADISAGLGVEMSRLILAYGQVKAANYLRGTELRQFSEAGIDMLGQLATYFTQLEGRLVTAADVFERISKRQVMFEDVDAVLERVTSRGGAFYKMQEEMATTVAGRISNLKDEFMLSMDEIGKSNNETILKVIRVLKWLAQNLDVVIEKLGFLLQVWMAWKATVIVNTVLTKGYAIAMSLVTLATHKATTEMNRLTAATHAFNAASKGNALLAIASLAVGLVGAFSVIPKALDSASESIKESELNEEMDQMADLANDVAKAFAEDQKEIGELSDKILGLTKSINALNKEEEMSVDTSDKVAAMMRERSILLSSLAGKTAEYSAELSAVLHDEEAMGRIIEQNNKKLAAKNVIGDRIEKDINMSKALKNLEEAYYRRNTQASYSELESGTDYDPKVIQKIYDPNGAYPAWVFEDREKVTENMQKYIATIDEAIKSVEGAPLPDKFYPGTSSYDLDARKADVDKNLQVWKNMDKDVLKKLDWDAQNYLGNLGTLVETDYLDTSMYHIAQANREQLRIALYDAWGHASKRLEEYSPELLLEDEDVTGMVNIFTEQVKKAFDTSGLESSSEEVREQTQRNIQAFLDNIFSAYEIPDDAKYQLQQLLGEALGFEWTEFKTPLATWHENFNRYTEEIRNSLSEQNIDIPFSINVIQSGDKKMEESKKEIEEDLKDVNEIIATYESNIVDGVSRLADKEEIAAMRYKAARDKLISQGFTLTAAENFLSWMPGTIDAFTPELSGDQYIGGKYTTAQYNEAKAQQPALEKTLKFHGTDKDKDKNKKSASEAIKAINDVHKAFKDLQKDFDDETSKIGAWEKYGKALEEALKPFNISLENFKSQFDLTTEDGMVAAFEWLKKQKAAANELYEIERAQGDVEWELKVENKNEADERLNREIEDLFAGYELSVELDELHIPKSVANKFFDIDVTSINDLRKKLFSRKDAFTGEEQEKEYQKFLDKLDEMETKSQQDRLKKYLEYSRETIGERGKVLLEGFYQLQDIGKAFDLTDTLALNEDLINEEQFEKMRKEGLIFSDLIAKGDEFLKSYGFTDEQIAKIKEYNEYLREQQSLAEAAAVKNVNEDLAKLDWERFTGSEVYQDLYNDMSNASASALTTLINKLEEHRDQWSKLPVDQVKEYVKLLNDAKDALSETKYPSEVIATQKEVIEKSGYSNIGEASKAMVNAQLEIEQLDIIESQWKTITRLKEEGNDDAEIALRLGISNQELVSKTKEELQSQRSTQEDIIDKAKEYLKAIEKIRKAYEKQREMLKKVQDAVNKIWEGWEDINSIFGDDTMSGAILGMVKGISDGAFGMADMISMAKQSIELFKTAEIGAKALGYAIDTASSILGIMVMAVKAVAAILKFVSEQHDKSIQEQIDAEIEKVEALQKAYEKLEEQISKAYQANDLAGLTGKASRNLREQIAATEQMIALEEDKKKSDEDTIKGWKDDIDALNDSLEELREQMFSTLTDGILDDVLGATRTFVDAWHDAYEETGEGMIGLEEAFTDMLRNMLRQQASMQLISPFVNKYKEWLAQYVGDENDPNLTVDEARAWADRVKATFPEVNELLKGFFEGTQDLLETNSELSDLEKGIQGMTEDQAEVLAAYWNSCRFTLTNIDMTLSDVADRVLGQSANGDAVLNELRTQTGILRDIWNALDSVIGVGGNTIHAGSYIKVNM